MAQNRNDKQGGYSKPTAKSFIIKFVRILVLCAIAYIIVFGAKYLAGMFS